MICQVESQIGFPLPETVAQDRSWMKFCAWAAGHCYREKASVLSKVLDLAFMMDPMRFDQLKRVTLI